MGRIICEITPDHLAEFKEHLGAEAVIIGHVTTTGSMSVVGQFDLAVDQLAAAFNGAPS